MTCNWKEGAFGKICSICSDLTEQGINRYCNYYYYFKFIVFLYLPGDGLLLSPDLNNKSKRFTPTLTERCVQCSLV
jgi:hypothetical protein